MWSVIGKALTPNEHDAEAHEAVGSAAGRGECGGGCGAAQVDPGEAARDFDTINLFLK